MNEEEKKATKMLDKFITEHKFYNIKHNDNLEDNIEIVLNLLEKLQKENEEIRIKNNAIKRESESYAEYMIRLNIEKQDYFEKYRYHLQQNESLTKEFSNVIPVQKVKDKIEEILNNKEYRIVFEGNAEFPDDATIINAQKYIKLEKMQELIEEREEK